MARWLNVKTGLIGFGVLLIVALGIAYALEIQREVSGSVIVGRVQTVDETILLYREEPPSTGDLTELNFGTADVTAFGFFSPMPRIPLWVKNGGGVPFQLRLEATDVKVNGSAVSGDIVSLLLGPPGGELLPSPDHATTINTGDAVAFEAGLTFLGTPEELGIGTGDRITFTALFKAEWPIPTPRPMPTPEFFTSSVKRLVVAVDRDLRDGNVPWRVVGSALSIRPMNEGLIVMDRFYGTFIPNLATDWVMSADGMAWTVSLQEDVPFQHGWGEFTARDVIHAWERAISEESVTSNKSLLQQAIQSTGDFEIVSDHQLVFNFLNLQPDWPVIMSELEEDFLITSKTQFDSIGTEGMEKAPAGTGPFRQLDRKLDEFALYERVENHWRQTPEFRELLIPQVEENATKLAMLLTEEAHIASLPRDLQEQALNRGLVRMQGSVPRGTAWHFILGGLYFQTPDKLDLTVPATDIRVREALNRAIDRQEIIDAIFAGRATLATHEVFQPSLAGWDPGWPDRFGDMYGYDPEKAKQLLADAGYDDGFDLDIYDFLYGGSPELNQINAAIAQYWNAIGVNTKLISVDYPTIRPDFMGKNLHGKALGFPPYGRYEPYVLMELVHKSDGPFVQYEDAVLDGLFDELAATLDADERDDIQRRMGEQLLVQYAVLPLVFTFFEGIINPEVVAEYVVPGNQRGGFTNIEYIKATR